MKKFFLSALFVFSVMVVMTQTVPREMVIMEVGTGTWCTYCPGAAMGADDLLANGCRVAVMEILSAEIQPADCHPFQHDDVD